MFLGLPPFHPMQVQPLNMIHHQQQSQLTLHNNSQAVTFMRAISIYIIIYDTVNWAWGQENDNSITGRLLLRR